MGSYYGVKADKLRRHYKKDISGFNNWDQKDHSEEYLYFSVNMGEYLSLDETSLSQGELYTYLTNKESKGKKGSLIASIKGTKAKEITKIITKIPLAKRIKVKEVTIDMARNMEAAVKACFPNAQIVTDRFHVVKLVLDSVQHLRVKLRWKAIDQENEAIKEAKSNGKRFKPKEFENGDTLKQLLARSRYILAKKEKNWTENQKQRAIILFQEFPELKKAYEHCMQLRNVYENTSKVRAEIQLNKWIEKTTELKIEQFYTAANSINYNKVNILNFFNNRSTNASAESFNSKIKLFRANLRGVSDLKFFLFRLTKLFA
ncbi:MAG: DDE transposase [Flavobacteriales bacterium]|nr:MAG: DDE transposase [Flavobacteriales bacterium]